MLTCNTDTRLDAIDRPAWARDLAPGHVVSFTVPARGRRRPDPEPHLILDLALLGEEPAVVLAPGLPATGRPARRGDVYCTADDLAAVRGLHAPVVFVAGRRLVLPLTHRGLVEAAHDGSPVLGTLSRPALGRLHRVRGRLDAERALAAHRRSRRYLAGRDAVRGADFEVVPRRPARGGERRAAPVLPQGGEGRA